MHAGFSNYTAPGADRLNLSISLKVIGSEVSKPSNFIELMEVRSGDIISVAQKQDYNELRQVN